MDSRGVSEVVSFILVFSLVIGTISLVYVGGFSGLQEVRDYEQNTNAERAFDVLARNVEEVARGKAPSRATEIKLSDATLSVVEPREVLVQVNGSSIMEPRPRPIVYDSRGGTKIVYEMGAVIRVEEGGARMVREPDYVFSEDVAVIRHVDTSGGVQSVGGSVTTLVRTRSTNAVLETESGDLDVTYRLNTTESRAPVWQEYLDDQESVSCDPETEIGPDQWMVECDIDVERLSVTRLYVNVELT